jgi:hypothetical protein
MTVTVAPIQVKLCNAARREPGTIYVTTRPGGLPTRAQYSWIVGIRQDGSIALNREYAGTSQDIRAIGNDRILFSQSAQGILNELDREGNVMRQWHARGKFQGQQPPPASVELPIDHMHHTVNTCLSL